MDSTQEKQSDSRNKTKPLKKAKGSEPHRVIISGQIEIAVWLSQTATGIPYPQFTFSRVFKSQSTGRQAASRYFDDTNEMELLEAVRKAAAASTGLADFEVG